VKQSGKDLGRKAASQLDMPWARSWAARTGRELFMNAVLEPTMDYYTRRRATGREKIAALKGPVILVANHCSHIDTPVILAALPRRLRRRTVVGAAADYFYKNRLIASIVSFIFNTVPLDRKGGGARAIDHVDRLLDQGWSLLLYPEGTRSRTGSVGRVRRGAAVLAARHNVPIVPIHLSGTRAAMPPGRLWPHRIRGLLLSRRHPVDIDFGEPIPPGEDSGTVFESLQRFFLASASESSNDGAAGRETNGAGRKRFARAGSLAGRGER
jgi:1-acyl-sn-glycerol-3-phosphate acyltransferase